MKYFEIILLTILSSSSYGERIYAPEFIGLSQLTQEYFLFSDSTPETQFEEFPTCKYGHRQTPIDISEPFEPTDLQLEFSRNYHEPVSKVGINNNGHYPQVTPFPFVPRRSVWFKGNEYIFEQVHFHSGANNHEGSDHSLFGKCYPLEVHFVHFQPKYDTLRDALEYEDGVLIIAALFEIGHYNPYIEFVVRNIQNIAIANDTIAVKTETALSDLLPRNKQFYFYEGSLEAPPCQETVNWIVFDDIQSLSEDQMACFRDVLQTPTGFVEERSFRFLQPRNHRTIYVSNHGSRYDSKYEKPYEGDYKNDYKNDYKKKA